MNHNHVMSALYDTHAEDEQAVQELQANGYDMKQLSIVGQEYHTE